MIMPSATEIESALWSALPPDLRGGAIKLAHLVVVASASGTEGSERISPIPPEIESALKALAGRKVETDSAVLSFGADNRFGDVKIGDVAGGNLFKNEIFLNPLRCTTNDICTTSR